MKNTNGTNEPAGVLFPSTCINMRVNLLSCEIFERGHPLVPLDDQKRSLPAPGSSEATNSSPVVSGRWYLLRPGAGGSRTDCEFKVFRKKPGLLEYSEAPA